MRFLFGEEEREAIGCIMQAVEIGKRSNCLRAKCGTVIVSNGEIIGIGYNSPPGEKETQRMCRKEKDSFHKKVSDKTCCVHAEQRAIIDACARNSGKVKGSRLYFIRLGENDTVSKAGKPYCTHCSKLALDAGIMEFVLWHDEGICVYDTEEYNLISFRYTE